MQKITTLLLGLAVSLSSQAQTIFSSTFNSQEEFDLWTVINANGDADNWGDPCTWKFSATNTDGQRTYYGYSSTNQADDWLISPALTFPSDGVYLFSYQYEAGTSYAEAMKVYVGTEPTVESLSANLVKDYPTILGVNTDYFLYEAKAGETVYIGFQACSEADKYRLFMEKFEVSKNDNPVDLSVTSFVSPESAEGLTSAETVKVKVANTGLATAAAGSTTLKLTVDGTEIATQTINVAIESGSEVEVEFDQKVDLSISHHNYNIVVEVINDNDVSASNNTLSTVVRHIGPAVEPYTMGFEATEDISDIKFFNLNDDSGYWSRQVNGWFVSPARTDAYCIAYNYSKDNAADDWAIIDGIQMGAGYHVLKFWVSTMDDSHVEGLHVFYGNEATPEAMTTEIASYDPFTTAEYIQKICIFELKEPQTVYIGFHATSPADQNWIAIDDIEVNSISADDVEIQVSDLTNPTEFLTASSNKDISFNIMNQGIVDVKATITATIDGEKVYEQEETLVAQENKAYTIKNALSSVSDGVHTLVVNAYNPDEKNVDDNTLTIKFRKLGATELSWDFEDGIVPESFTLRREEYTALSESAIAEFGETGIGIMNIQEHQYYGTKMLGVSTWLTEAASADAWVVMPKVHVDSEDACFVFNAGSASTIAEKYRIKVSTGDDAWWDYDTVLKVDSETYNRQNRGVNLGEYVGKDIYIAINVVTYDGDCISFDNLGIYDCTAATTAVKNISTEANTTVKLVGETLHISGNDVKSVNIYDLNGRLMMQAAKNSVNISNLGHGVYVVKATTANGTTTAKIVK
jgi:hypothetical protein